MTQQVLYDATGRVLQWQDTAQFNYSSPGADATMAVSASQWANQSGEWWVVNSSLTQSDPNAPTSAQILAQAQSAQTTSLRQSYLAAISANISFTDSASVTDTYQADPPSVQALNNCLSGFRAASAVPTGFYWRSATNQNNPFTYADLEGLASAMTARGFTNYAHLQTQAASVMAAATISAVNAVTW